ncbi:MAG: hypothetical protein FJ263_08030 [Planctomycetes bacterium]|nr:hypothetical protein [Planctomycetota bacterium]
MKIVIFGVCVFLSAFLLFQVQPLMGRFLLPWFGGSPEVWTACMLFFQLFLLAGYAWAHLNTRFFSPRQQTINQILLLAAAGVMLSIVPTDSFKPSPGQNPILQILLICTVCVGLPYFLLATTGPVLQAWFARLFPAKEPYRLYALGNAGSLLALISFPLLFEPNLTRFTIAKFWSAGFLAYAILYASVAVGVWKNYIAESSRQAHLTAKPKITAVAPKLFVLWLVLPACASVELLAVTTKITQDIAVIPFLWIVPLCLYLLSFILCFDHPRWYVRPVFLSLFIASIVGVIFARNEEGNLSPVALIVLYTTMLFFCSMVCHGELYRLRPQASHLTTYYLAIAAGGAIGGVFVAVIAPLIFSVYHELHIGLLVCAATVLMAQQGLTVSQQKRRQIWVFMLLIAGTIGIIFQGRKTIANQTAIDNCRNFFGVLTVWEESPQDPQMHKLLLQHGTTFHGLQFQNPQKKLLPTAYYSPKSGIGLLLRNMPRQNHRKIGIVGLGVGTIAIYGQPSDTIRFYEINPQVEQMARKYFSYLSQTKAEIEIVLGDARLSMENESPQKYDVLVLDAFSSDAVPVHLLTEEAFAIYLKHLAPDGVLAFHISTMHLNLHSVVWKAAKELGLSSTWIENDDDPETGKLASDWILLSRESSALNIPALEAAASPQKNKLPDIRLWTDDHINLLQILK